LRKSIICLRKWKNCCIFARNLRAEGKNKAEEIIINLTTIP